MGSRRVNANQRLRWTDELHQRFADVVAQLGGRDRAKPKDILGLMGEPAVTLKHVKSHLQKYRLAASIPESSSSHGRKANRKEPPAKTKEQAAKRKEMAASSSKGKRARKTVNANQRLHWTDELHQRFADAVAQLGGRVRAKPKDILGLMGEPAITLKHVKSHLQKYRLAASIPESSSCHGRKANRKKPVAKRKEPVASSFKGKRARKTVTGKEAVEDTRSDADLEALKLRADGLLELNVQLEALKDMLKNMVNEALQIDF